jgi:hypothetical protein
MSAVAIISEPSSAGPAISEKSSVATALEAITWTS